MSPGFEVVEKTYSETLMFPKEIPWSIRPYLEA